MIEKSRPILPDLGKINDLWAYPYATLEFNNIPDYQARTLYNYEFGKARRADVGNFLPNSLGEGRLQGVGRGDRKIFNACVHRKVQSVSLPYGFLILYPWYPVWHYQFFYQRDSVGASPGDRPSVVQEEVHMPSHVDFLTARARAWHNMQPRFEGAVSMINFLFEMKDFKEVSKALVNLELSIYKISKKLSKQVSKWNKSRDVRVWGFDPTLPAAEALLVNNFAVQPLIRDVADIMLQATLIVAEVQRQFYDDGLSFQKTHHSETIVHEENLVDPGYGLYPYYRRSGRVWKTRFTGHLYYKYSYDMRSAYEAFMKYWGLSGSFEAVWNAMPFSFLVDYFVQIGKSLHYMERDPNVTLTEWFYGESYKTTITSGWYILDTPFLSSLVIDGNTIDLSRSPLNFVSGWKGTLYDRKLTEPVKTMAFPKLKLPSGSQYLNMLALARCFL